MRKVFTKDKRMIAFICLLIGFMMAVLFNTNKAPDERDTRDTWEVRTSLLQEQKNQQKLYEEIAEEEQTLQKYQNQTEHQKINSLKESIKQLREQAGLKEKEGKGLLLTLEPMFLDKGHQAYPKLNAELLQLLINELNAFGAKEIAIEGQRMIATTPIRNVNGEIYVNHTSIGSLPTKIHILTTEPNQLIKHLEVSEIIDYFALENISVHSEESSNITLPKYQGTVNFNEIGVVGVEEGE